MAIPFLSAGNNSIPHQDRIAIIGRAAFFYTYDFALQNELTMEENIALARRFVEEQFVSRGMIVDFAVHAPDKEKGGIPNPHVLKWGAKQHRVYHLDERGERIRDENGKYVFDAVPTTDWGKKETLLHWREEWANYVTLLWWDA